jgi:hypothetical protein
MIDKVKILNMLGEACVGSYNKSPIVKMNSWMKAETLSCSDNRIGIAIPYIDQNYDGHKKKLRIYMRIRGGFLVVETEEYREKWDLHTIKWHQVSKWIQDIVLLWNK